MTDPRDELTQLDEATAEMEADSAGIEARKQALATKRQDLRERIRAGATTGDEILDFVVVCGLDRTTIEPELRRIETAMSAHPGEYVLTMGKQEEPNLRYVHGLEPRARDYHLEINVGLGLIPDSGLVIDTTGWSLTLSAASVQIHWMGPKLTQPKAPMTLRLMELCGLNSPMTYKNPRNGPLDDNQSDYQFVIIIGDADVATWLKLQLFGNLGEAQRQAFREAAAMLGRPLSKAPEFVAAFEDAADWIEGIVPVKSGVID